MAKIELMINERPKEDFEDGKITFNKLQLKKWKKVYGIVGHHSAVQICMWNKKAIKREAVCYKQKFYGIDAHRCAQMSPAAAWCNEGCVFCWRPMEWYSRVEMKEEEVDDPQEIIEGTVRERKKLISGFGGNPKANKKYYREAYERFPSHWAISLSGEPTIYPKLGELIRLLKQNPEVKSVFVVSNGQLPEALLKLKEMNALPTQLYISIDAPNEELFKKINRSVYKDGWQRLMRTIKEVLPNLNCRRVLRFTQIKGLNDSIEFAEDYAKIFEASKADFIEMKSYIFIGESRKRLNKLNVPSHEEVVEYAKEVLKYMPNYSLIDEDRASKIVLLKRKDSPYRNQITSPYAEETTYEAVSAKS